VRKALDEAGSMEAESALTMEVVKATKFEDVKKYFRCIQSSTAPNGYGYVVKVKLLGTMFAVPPIVISFDAGFPPALAAPASNLLGMLPGGGKTNTFYLRSASHSLSAAGYYTDIEVVDCFIMWGQVGLQ
jgi:hypothetical protein